MDGTNDHAGEFWQPKTTEELAKEQGVVPVADASRLFGQARDLWKDDEEFEEFVAGIYERRAEGGRPADDEAQPGAA